MARHAIPFWLFSLMFDDINEHENYVTWVRDQFRDTLQEDPEGPESFVVSDITKWQGSSSDRWGYAFVVKGSTYKWAFFFIYEENSTSVNVGRVVGNTDHTIVGNHFNEPNGSNAGWRDNYNYAHHYIKNDDEDWAMGFDDETNLTYNEGDFQEPATNPYSDLDGFMPDDPTHKAAFWAPDSQSNETHIQRCMCIYDDELDVFTFYTNDRRSPYFRECWMWGNALFNTNPADPDNSILLHFRMNWGNTTSSHSNWWGEVLTPTISQDTVRIKEPDYKDNHFRERNSFDSQNKLKWKGIHITTENYTKGYIDTSLVRLQGPMNTNFGNGIIVEGPLGPLVKHSTYLATPWAEDLPAFPWFPAPIEDWIVD